MKVRTGVQRRERLLINWVYYHAVGHAIEAYKMAAQVAAVNPELELCVPLNATTAVELGACVPGLALERSGVAIPDSNRVERFDGPGGFVDVGEAVAPAIEVVIEGDGILRRSSSGSRCVRGRATVASGRSS